MSKIYSINDIKNIANIVFSNTPVLEAILFGSYANGQASKNSDIDIFVKSNGVLKGLNFYGVLEDLTTKFKKNIDLIEELEIEKGSRIENEIIKQGIKIYERRQ